MPNPPCQRSWVATQFGTSASILPALPCFMTSFCQVYTLATDDTRCATDPRALWEPQSASTYEHRFHILGFRFVTEKACTVDLTLVSRRIHRSTPRSSADFLGVAAMTYAVQYWQFSMSGFFSCTEYASCLNLVMDDNDTLNWEVLPIYTLAMDVPHLCTSKLQIFLRYRLSPSLLIFRSMQLWFLLFTNPSNSFRSLQSSSSSLQNLFVIF